MRITLIGIVVGALTLLASTAATAREWHSRSGGFSVEAELVDVQNDKVMLKKQDGTLLTIALEKLSLADVRYVKQALRDAEKDVKGDKVDKEGVGDAKGAGEPKPEADRDAAEQPKDSEKQPAQETAARPDDFPLAQEGSGDWQVKPDPPKTPLAIPKNAKIAIPLPASYSNNAVIYPSAPSPFVATGGGHEDKDRRVWDLRTGKAVGRIGEIPSVHQIALSPDGTRLAVAQLGTESGLSLWSFRTGKLERKLETEGRHSISGFMDFAGPDRVVAQKTGKPAISVWSVDSGKVIAKIDHGEGALIGKQCLAVSPGGHYLAVMPLSNPIRIYDTRNGVEAGRLGSTGGFAASYFLSFSPDGKELAGVFSGGDDARLICWNMANGEQTVKLSLPKEAATEVSRAQTYQGSPLEWYADGRGWLLCGSGFISREKGDMAWLETPKRGRARYTTRRMVDDSRMLVVDGDRRDQVLRLAPIPAERIAAGMKAVAAGGKSDDVGLPPLTKVDRSKVKMLTSWTSQPWTYKPPAAPEASKKLSGNPISLDSHTAGVRDTIFADGASKALVGVRDVLSRRSSASEPHRDIDNCDRYDLLTGKRDSRFEVPFAVKLLDFSPDGKLALFSDGDENDRLDIWSMDDRKHYVGFRPYLGAGRREERVTWGAMIDAKHVLTLNARGNLVLWALPECKAVYSVDVRLQSHPKLAPGRRCLAIGGENSIALLDPLTGQGLGSLPVPETASAIMLRAFAFRGDGKQAAATFGVEDGTVVAVWDLASGKLSSEFWLPETQPFLVWCGPRHVMLRAPYRDVEKTVRELRRGNVDPTKLKIATPLLWLVDLDRKAVVWQYQMDVQRPAENAPDDRFWFIASRDILATSRLVALGMPDAEAQGVIAATPPSKPIVKPGDSVTLSVELKFCKDRKGKEKEEAELRSLVEEYVKKVMADNRLSNKPKSPILMKVVVEERVGDDDVKIYVSGRSRYRSGAVLVLNPMEVRCDVSFVDSASGKTQWTLSRKFSPKDSRGTKTMERPDKELPASFRTICWQNAVGWCGHLRIPQEVYPAVVYEGLGESALTPDGAVRKKKG